MDEDEKEMLSEADSTPCAAFFNRSGNEVAAPSN